jgi:hypothetical protein
MKKRILLIVMVIFITTLSAQNAESYETFEGADPLNNLPTGVTSVNPIGNAIVYIAKDRYYFNSLGGSLITVPTDGGELVSRAQFANIIVTDSDTSSKAFQGDYTGHIIIDEASLGGGDFSIVFDYRVFGHSMASTDSGIITIVGQDAGVWKDDRLTARNGGFASGMGLAAGGANGFVYGNTALPPNDDVVLTYTSSDQLYRFYKNGTLMSTSSAAQDSGEWDNRKIYIGFAGRNSIGNGNGASHLNATTGEFDANGVRNDGRNNDLQTRVDNISVFKRAISQTEITSLYGTDGTDGTSPLEVASVSWDGSESSDWANGDNWSTGAVPTATSVITIPAGMPNDPIIGSTTGAAGYSLDVDGAATLTVVSGGSLIVSGTSIGNVTYNVAVTDTDWHLVSSPVLGEDYNDTWVTINSIATGTESSTNRGIATYQNGAADLTTGNWVYMQGGASGTYGNGVGYSLLSSTGTGNFSFTGTVNTSDISPSISQSVNNWNLIGNSYTSYLDVTAFIAANTSNFGSSFLSIYVWNGSGYVETTTGYVYPGQAFFVSASATGTIASFTPAMQSHQTGITFLKSSNTETSIKLNITNGSSNKITKINYLDGKTRGLDPGFDIGMFNGVSSDLRVYTQLLEDNEGIAFARQALPISDIEAMIIPLGVKAAAGKEITFTAEALNLPEGIKVFLEDRQENVITRLDEENAKYEVTLSESLNGVGRFFIHTSAKSALSVGTALLETVSVYQLDNATLRVAGLSQGKASVKLFNVLGKQMMQTSFEANTSRDIALPNLAKGIYIVQLETENGSLNKKIILE